MLEFTHFAYGRPRRANTEEKIQFEAIGAPIPIMAARWDDNNYQDTEIFFHNEKFLSIYGDFRKQRLRNIFDKIMRTDGLKHTQAGRDLLHNLIRDGKITDIHGTLSGYKVCLFARVQNNKPNTIQATIFDTTDHYLMCLHKSPDANYFLIG